jgi:hypothetical protein
VTQQLQKSIDFRRFELYEFHLWFRNTVPVHIFFWGGGEQEDF